MDVNIVYSDDIIDVVEYCEVISVSLCKTIVRPKYSRNLPKQLVETMKLHPIVVQRFLKVRLTADI